MCSNRFQMKKPGLVVIVDEKPVTLYMEAEQFKSTHENLEKTLAGLNLGDGQIINITDPTQVRRPVIGA